MMDLNMGRRGLLAGAAAVGLGLGWARALADPVATAVSQIVTTSNGPVVGVVSDAIQTFKGLRYGAPPTGPLRFMPPRKPAPWTEPALGQFYGAAAMQLLSGGGAAGFPG